MIVRIDEDCIMRTSIDSIFDLLMFKDVVFGKWVADSPTVTHGLQSFTRKHLLANGQNHIVPKVPSGPYTNVIGFNVSELRNNLPLFKYIQEVKNSLGIYVYRWGDLALWGDALIYLVPSVRWCLDKRIHYFHGSHGVHV